MTNKLIEHSAFGTVQPTEEYTYSYGSRLRLDSVNYKLNGEKAGVNIAAYKYNNLGQVQEKKTGGGKETTAFEYNVRGWDTKRPGQKFSENLSYESGHPKSGSAVYYGGNVSAMTWKAYPSTDTVRGYSFTYDALGQLSSAVYGEGVAINTNPLRYDESFTYDKHGNVNTLKRYGLKDNNTFGIIDDLAVTCIGNTIRTISDADGNQSSSDVMELKFNNVAINDGHYHYNGTGSLIADYHKRICMMKYNYLTLPQSVQFTYGDRIEYVYDAAGVKRQVTRKVANRNMNYGYWSLDEPAASDFNSALTVTTDYWGNKVYVNSQLKYILTEEGYIEKTAGSNTYNAYYYLNDHLSNHRIVMDAAGAVKQVNNFYPSGTSIAEYPRRTDQGVQPYKYEGKELDRTNGLDFYDFEARAFDPVLMRFTVPDPLAEKYPGISPYAFCGNNPVKYVDPTGMYFDEVNEKRAQRLEQKIDKQVTKLEKQVASLEKAGKDVGDRRDRISTLQGSKSDIADMRSNEGTEFRYGKTSDKNNKAGKGNPVTLPAGTNEKGDNVVTMYSDDVGSQIHESTHGGQVARSEYGFDQRGNPTTGYGLNSEVSAYRAQYAYDGTFNYRQADYLRNAPDGIANIFSSIGASIIPIVKVNNINSMGVRQNSRSLAQALFL
jgi:RHS repeat-associated protein